MNQQQITKAASNAITRAQIAHGAGWSRVSADHRYGAISRIVIADYVAHAPDARVMEFAVVMGSDEVLREVVHPQS